MMEEELGEILENAELDNEAKQKAIKALVGKSFVSNEQYNKIKKEQTKQDEDYKALKTEFDTFKESKMSDEEKQEEATRKMQEQYEKANLTISKMYAENTFTKAGFKEDDYKDILDNIVSEDTEKTKELAKTICASMLRQKADIEKTMKDKIIKGQTPPPAGNDNNKGSGDEIENYKKLYQEAVEKNDFPKMAMYTRLVQEAQMKQKNI